MAYTTSVTRNDPETVQLFTDIFNVISSLFNDIEQTSTEKKDAADKDNKEKNDNTAPPVQAKEPNHDNEETTTDKDVHKSSIKDLMKERYNDFMDEQKEKATASLLQAYKAEVISYMSNPESELEFVQQKGLNLPPAVVFEFNNPFVNYDNKTDLLLRLRDELRDATEFNVIQIYEQPNQKLKFYFVLD